MIVPKGKLISIGGAEDKGTEPEPDFLQKKQFEFFRNANTTTYCARSWRT
jgi:hypothetical protein